MLKMHFLLLSNVESCAALFLWKLLHFLGFFDELKVRMISIYLKYNI